MCPDGYLNHYVYNIRGPVGKKKKHKTKCDRMWQGAMQNRQARKNETGEKAREREKGESL